MARAFVRFTKACPTGKSTLPLTVASQLQKLGFLVTINASKSNVIHRHKPTNAAAKAQPITVRFFQSELKREEQVTCVPESTEAKLMAIVFLAVLGDIPHSDPCLTNICLGGSSETIVQPFSKRTAFKSAYALSIPKLTVCLSNHGTA